MRIVFILILSVVLISGTFSPQYLIWIAPFVAFLDIPGALMFIGASSLTWIYFRYWDDVIRLAPMASSVLILRNVLLVLLLIYEIIRVIMEIRNNGKI